MREELKRKIMATTKVDDCKAIWEARLAAGEKPWREGGILSTGRGEKRPREVPTSKVLAWLKAMRDSHETNELNKAIEWIEAKHAAGELRSSHAEKEYGLASAIADLASEFPVVSGVSDGLRAARIAAFYLVAGKGSGEWRMAYRRVKEALKSTAR